VNGGDDIKGYQDIRKWLSGYQEMRFKDFLSLDIRII
jgi:hypothetical protein